MQVSSCSPPCVPVVVDERSLALTDSCQHTTTNDTSAMPYTHKHTHRRPNEGGPNPISSVFCLPHPTLEPFRVGRIKLRRPPFRPAAYTRRSQMRMRPGSCTTMMIMNCTINTRQRRAFGKRPPAPRKPKGKPGRSAQWRKIFPRLRRELIEKVLLAE